MLGIATGGSNGLSVKALAISDKIIDAIYSPAAARRFADVDLVISCGDLPYYYLEYLVSTLNKPLFYVRGNHAPVAEYSENAIKTAPGGAVDLDSTVVTFNGLIMAGFEGSIRYNNGPFQYTDEEMHWRVSRIVPRLVLNRLRHGRYLDVLVAHSPPLGVQDEPDRTHTGFAAFRWFLQRFKPRYMLHGHIHVYNPQTVTRSLFHQTEVINCYGSRELELQPGPMPAGAREGQEQDHVKSDDELQLRASNVEGVLESD